MSRIDFTPAQTTQIPTRASVPRSADSSNVSRAPRCTPPSPPVANTRMPARSATCAVAATVVAPCPPRVSTGARSRTPHLRTPSVSASSASDASSSPTRSSPAMTAIVAGTAPCSRTAASISRATGRFSGRGSPWAMIVLSSATTGRPSASAVSTSGSTRIAGRDYRGRDHRPGRGELRPERWRAGVLRLLRELVLGEDLVERAPGVGEDLARLVGVPGGDALHRGAADLEHQAPEVHDVLVHAALDGVPRLAEVRAVVRDVRAALLGQLVDAAPVLLGRADQALVLELLERRVDGAGARLPQAVRAALDLLDELVAVLRLLVQQHEHGGADVAAAGASAAAAAAAAPVTGTEEQRLELTRVAAERAAGPAHEVHELVPRCAAVLVVMVLVAPAWAGPLLCMCMHVFRILSMCCDASKIYRDSLLVKSRTELLRYG